MSAAAAYAQDSHFEAATSAAVVAVDVAAENVASMPATGPCADELYLAAAADLDIAAVVDSGLVIVRIVVVEIALHLIVAHAHAVVQTQDTWVWVLAIFYQKRQRLQFPHIHCCFHLNLWVQM